MKRQFISITVILAVVSVALVTFAQQDEARNEREGYSPEVRDAMETIRRVRKSRPKALEILPDHLAKLSDLFKNRRMLQPPHTPREEMKKKLEAWQKQWDQALEDLELQVAMLKGPMMYEREHRVALDELRAIRQLSAAGQSQEATKQLDKLIEKKEAEFKKFMERTGFQGFSDAMQLLIEETRGSRNRQ